MQNITKKLSVDARRAYILLRELCVHALDYTEIFSTPSLTSAPLLMRNGTDAIIDISAPQTIESAYLFNELSISSYANNGGGLVRATVASLGDPAVISTDTVVITGTTSGIYDGTWTITVIDPTHIDLVGSTYSVNPVAKGSCLPTASIIDYTVKYVTLGGAVNHGIYKIDSQDPYNHTITVVGGLYGAAFTTEAGIDWWITDPSSVPAGDLQFVVEGSGTTPKWQASFDLGAGITDRFSYTVAPTGGYAATGICIGPVTSTQTIIADFSFMWYFLLDSDYIRIWTENAAATGVYNIGYIGAGNSRRDVVHADLIPSNYADNGAGKVRVTVGSVGTPAIITGNKVTISGTSAAIYDGEWLVTVVNPTHIDLIGSSYSVNPTIKGSCIPGSSFAVCCGGSTFTALSTVASIGTDDITPVDYSYISYGITGTPDIFSLLPASPFDLRNDAVPIAIGCEDTLYEDDRGTLQGLYLVSSSLTYKSFVDNGRKLLCLGNGFAVAWNGDLAR